MSVVAATDQSGQAGPLGLLVIVLLAVATGLLIRSMSRHLRRIPPTFERTAEPGQEPPAEPPAHSES